MDRFLQEVTDEAHSQYLFWHKSIVISRWGKKRARELSLPFKEDDQQLWLAAIFESS